MEDNCENRRAEFKTQCRRQHRGINLLQSEWKFQTQVFCKTSYMSQRLCRIIHRSVLDLQSMGLPKAGVTVISVQVSERLSSQSPRGSQWGRASRNRCIKCCFSLKTQIFASSLELQPKTFPENRFDCLSFWVRLTVFF